MLNNPGETLALILSAWSGCVGLASTGSAEGESLPAAPPSWPEPQNRRTQTTIESERQEAERQGMVIDTAPRDSEPILEIAKDASLDFDEENFPDAGTLLHTLMSEVRVRIYNLPLATYPKALKSASHFLKQGKRDEADSILSAALNTLVALDEVTPIPLIVAFDAINDAQAQLDSPAEALRLLKTARNELLRAKLLGYAGRAPEYASLNEEISKLERQLKNKEEPGRSLAALKEKLGAFLNLNWKRRRLETHRKQEN